MKKCQKDRKQMLAKTLRSGEYTIIGSSEHLAPCHELRPEPRTQRDSDGLFSTGISSRQNQTSSSGLGKTDEIKFSIDYILSAPDPLPILRPQHNIFDNKFHILDTQQRNLHLWSLQFMNNGLPSNVILKQYKTLGGYAPNQYQMCNFSGCVAVGNEYQFCVLPSLLLKTKTTKKFNQAFYDLYNLVNAIIWKGKK